jgi:hypothetical protein
MCHNLDYICFTWLREQWSEVTGQPLSINQQDDMWSTDGVCFYLTNYLTKASYPDWILGILYKKHLWASTMPDTPHTSQGFVQVGVLKGTDAKLAVSCQSVPLAKRTRFTPQGDVVWDLGEGIEGEFASWRYQEMEGDRPTMTDYQELWDTPKARYMDAFELAYQKKRRDWLDDVPIIDGSGKICVDKVYSPVKECQGDKKSQRDFTGEKRWPDDDDVQAAVRENWSKRKTFSRDGKETWENVS